MNYFLEQQRESTTFGSPTLEEASSVAADWMSSGEWPVSSSLGGSSTQPHKKNSV